MNVTFDRKLQLLVRDLERSSKLQPQAYRVEVAALADHGRRDHELHHGPGAEGADPGVSGLFSLIGRSLWVHFEPPVGQPLDRQSLPRLFGMLDEVCATLKAPRFDHVFLDNDFYAGIMQVPRLGLLGWQTNYLVIGLPLMLALSPAQFRAVIAHEVGHLSGNHGRSGSKEEGGRTPCAPTGEGALREASPD